MRMYFRIPHPDWTTKRDQGENGRGIGSIPHSALKPVARVSESIATQFFCLLVGSVHRSPNGNSCQGPGARHGARKGGKRGDGSFGSLGWEGEKASMALP